MGMRVARVIPNYALTSLGRGKGCARDSKEENRVWESSMAWAVERGCVGKGGPI